MTATTGRNRPILVAANGNSVTYTYGPDGARLKKIVGSSTTLYLGDAIERDPAGAYTFYLAADVKRANGALSILGLDTQGSVRRLTDASGVLYRASTYEPFGAQVETVINALSAPERKGYIGERTDPETGLTHLHARYYDSLLGRWVPIPTEVGCGAGSRGQRR
jgi:RHS repeat-associated protein